MNDTFYDPDHAPDPCEWLDLDEQERIMLAKDYHTASRIKMPDVDVHASVHVVVENQIAEGFTPTCRAMDRLQKEGLVRHDAVHAVGSVVVKIMHDTMHGTITSAGDVQRELGARLDALSAASWLQNGDD